MYLVGESKNVDTVAELLQIVPVYWIKWHFETMTQRPDYATQRLDYASKARLREYAKPAVFNPYAGFLCIVTGG